jgi:hypothetical protein
MKREYFVLYDYGQGGLWTIVVADSAEQIRRRLPEVMVFDAPPASLSTEAVDAIRAQGLQSIDANPLSGWLADLDARRS